MKKNKIILSILLSCVAISGLFVPIKAKAVSTQNLKHFTLGLAGGAIVGYFILGPMYRFFFDSSDSAEDVGFSAIKLKLVKGDITKQNDVDVIVNAANEKLSWGAGVCGAIHKKADGFKLQKECEKELKKHGGKIKVGQSVMTDGFNLKKNIIHTVAPNFNPDNKSQKSIPYNQKGKELLHSAYLSALNLAVKKNKKKIALPFLSGGHFVPAHADKQELADIAMHAVEVFCNRNSERNVSVDEIRFVLYGKQEFDIFSKAKKKYIK